jgi:response regulator RpfG family c-di-GMP phosphodiesterase
MEAKPKILCVDDEPNVLEGLQLNLRRRFDVVTATSGALGLEELKRSPHISVVVSDMRMPVMDGAKFLAAARLLAPDATRMLLTGQADLTSTIAAVNEGQIFRFLSKPCAPPMLLAAVEAAAEQHRLVTAERVLLEQTLAGSIKALTDVLALVDPVSSGRAARVKRQVSLIADKLALKEKWQVEVAALLSQLGCIVLPTPTAEKVARGDQLTDPEKKMVERVPGVTEQLLGHIPRLEGVRAILSGATRAPGGSGPFDLAAQILRVALDFDSVESQGSSASLAAETLRSRAERYDKSVLEALVALHGNAEGDQVSEVMLHVLRTGMVIVEDLRMVSGVMLAGRGYEITASFVERLRNLKPGTVKEPVRVILRKGS